MRRKGKRRRVRTASFALGRYAFDFIDAPVVGMCELPDDKDRLYMMIPNTNTKAALQTCIHEMGHASGIPKRYLDGDRDVSMDIGAALWRMGWRRVE